MVEAYAEYGAMGVIVMLFITMIQFLRSTLMGKLKEVENICINMIARWNRSDEVRDRRYEQLLQEINDITDHLNFLKGKSNGKG